jgi:hypothetical protein
MTIARGTEVIDEIAVQRAVEGDRGVRLTAGEMAEAFGRLQQERDGQGNFLSDAEIAEVLGVDRRSIQRWKNGDSAPIGRAGRPVDVRPREVETTPTAERDDSIDGLLRHAATMKSAKVKTALDRVNRTVATLRILIDSESKNLQARAEIERLEKELAAARAKLKGPGRRYGPMPGVVGVSLRDVWDWAVTQGYERKRGRPNNLLIKAYKEAHGIEL